MLEFMGSLFGLCIHASQVDTYTGIRLVPLQISPSLFIPARLGAVVGPLGLVCYEKDESQSVETIKLMKLVQFSDH